jgi:Na+(H+)/acetate symporter ActP
VVRAGITGARLIGVTLTADDTTQIQTVAAIIQAVAAAVFLGTVLFNVIWQRYTREQERRYNILRVLLYEWTQSHLIEAKSPAERAGFISFRQIDFFNKRLKEIGERWTVPASKRGMVVVPILPG